VQVSYAYQEYEDVCVFEYGDYVSMCLCVYVSMCLCIYVCMFLTRNTKMGVCLKMGFLTTSSNRARLSYRS
jgi:hypothetical protein